MQSLRTRRSQADRKPKAGAKATPRPAQPATARTRDARKSRVDDKIKKRMSMRYADISLPTDAQGIPAVPALPIAGMQRTYSPEPYEERDDATRERRRMDARERELKMLDEKGFDPDVYLKAKLANSTEAELKSLQSSLRQSKEDTTADLQKNVFKNYAEFVHISKEISALENEMLELKEALSEWKAMPSLLQVENDASAADRRRNVRSSVADLRVLYASQMQALHQQVEGSAKFVPTTPGRHVVAELDNGIVALHAATYRPSHGVRFVILDDAVLVARKRQRRAEGGKGAGWVAERCWPLAEMVVLDTKDSPNLANVLKIRHLKETHVYKTEQASEKRTLLAQLRHVGDELQSRRQREREGEHERRKTAWMGDRGARFDPNRPGADWMAELAREAGLAESSSGGAKEKVERDTRFVGDFTDDLIVAIVLREFERAVELVEEGEKKVGSIPALASQLAALTASLTAALLSSLAAPSLRKAGVLRLIGLLTRVHAGAAARAAFLDARAKLIARRVRAIPLRGDAAMYAHDLAVVVFMYVKHTAEWYLAACKANSDASTFVEWARGQAAVFADVFRKQVYGADADPKEVKKALDLVQAQSKKLLQEFGIDFRYLLDDLLMPMATANANATARAKIAAPTPRPMSGCERASQVLAQRDRDNGTRTPTQPRSKSPAATTPAIARARSPVPPMPKSAGAQESFSASLNPPTSATSRAPSPSGTPSRMRSPAPPVAQADSSSSMNYAPSAPSTPSAIRPSFSSTSSAGSRLRPSRTANASPAPPPRSRDRPDSSHGEGDRISAASISSTGSGGKDERRAPPVAVPRRDNMF